jgi:HEAT repeat protein
MALFGPPNVEEMAATGNVKGLVKALSYRKDSDVQCRAARELGKLGGARAAEGLVAALRNPADVRSEVIGALVKIGAPAVGPLIAVLRDSSLSRTMWYHPHAIEALVRIGAPAVKPLVALLADAKGVRYTAAEVLTKIGAPAVESLIDALWTSGLAAKALGEIGDARAIKPLIDALNDRRYRFGAPGQDALVAIGIPAVEPLTAALQDRTISGRMRLLWTLGKIVEAHPEMELIEAHKVLGEYEKERAKAEAKQQAEAKRQAEAAAAGPAYRGGLGEPYCSQACYARAAQYAMAEIPGARCGVCGKPASSQPGQRDYAVIPYEGKTLVVCQSCAPSMRTRFQNYHKCAMCQKAL